MFVIFLEIGVGILSSLSKLLNFSLSNILLNDAKSVPKIFTFKALSNPSFASFIHAFIPVCPPKIGIIASGLVLVTMSAKLLAVIFIL